MVNRGWVPRSWKEKSLEDLQSSELPSNTATPSVKDSESSSWWRIWSKKPKNIEVCFGSYLMPCSGGAYQRYNLNFCNLQVNAPAVIPSEVVGVVRGSEKPSIFVPANDPSSCQWFYVDVPALAHAAGLPENTIYIEDINENVNPSNPYPIPKDANTLIRSSVMPQDHLNYTFTWYAFASLDTPNFGCTCNPLLKRLVCCYCVHNHSLFIYALISVYIVHDCSKNGRGSSSNCHVCLPFCGPIYRPGVPV